MEHWVLECFFVVVLILKVRIMAYPLSVWWPEQPSSIRTLAVLASGYLPCLLAELAGFRTFRFLAAYYGVLVLVGLSLWLRRIFTERKIAWHRYRISEVFLLVVAVAFWQWGFGPFYFMPSGDDPVVHAYLFDQIFKHGALLSAFNPVPHQEVFGPHQYIFYPTAFHGVVAALGLDLIKIFGPTSQLVLMKGAWLSLYAWFLLSAFRYAHERLRRAEFGSFVSGICVVFLVYTWLWGPVTEGAWNRTASFLWAGTFLVQAQQFSGGLLFRDWLLVSFSLGLVFLVHPAGGLLALVALFPDGLELLIRKKFRKVAIVIMALISSFAFVFIAQKAGASHLASAWEGYFPKDHSGWFKEGLLLFYGWLKGGFWWQEDCFGVGVSSITRAILLLSGLYSVLFLRSSQRLRGVFLTLIGFALIFSFLVKGGVRSAAPLTMVFYNGVGAYSGRLKEISGLIGGMIVLEGLVYWSGWFVTPNRRRYFSIALVISGFALAGGLFDVVRPYLLRTKIDFRPPAAQFIAQELANEMSAPDTAVLVDPADGSRGIGLLKSSLPNEPVMRFPECLPEIGVTSAHCESRIRYLEEVFSCVRKVAGGPGQKCCEIARIPAFSRKRLILTWIDNSFGPVKSLKCLPVE